MKERARRILVKTSLKKGQCNWHAKSKKRKHFYLPPYNSPKKENCNNHIIISASCAIFHAEICQLCELYIIKKDLRISHRGTLIVPPKDTKD